MAKVLTPPKRKTDKRNTAAILTEPLREYNALRSNKKRKKNVISGTAKLTRGKKVSDKPVGDGRFYQDIPDFYYGIKRN